MLTNSQKKANNKKGVGTIFAFILKSGLRITNSMDKNNSNPTPVLIISKDLINKVGIYQMVGCYCYHLHAIYQSCEV